MTPQLPDGAGIIPRAIADIFTMARRREAAQLPPVAIYCSFVQIYNEQVCWFVHLVVHVILTYHLLMFFSFFSSQLFDMLRDGSRGNPLVIHEDSNHEIYVEGLSEYRVRNVNECLALLRMGTLKYWIEQPKALT